MSEDANHNFSVEDGLAAQNAAHCGNKIMLRNVLEDIPRRARFESFQEILRAFVHGNKNHFCRRILLLNAAAGSQAIQLWHTHVNQREIWLKTATKGEYFLPIFGLAYQFQPAMISEHGTQTCSS